MSHAHAEATSTLAYSTPRFEALKARHTKLSQQIETLQAAPTEAEALKQLKVEKLRIKEEIEGIRNTSSS